MPQVCGTPYNFSTGEVEAEGLESKVTVSHTGIWRPAWVKDPDLKRKQTEKEINEWSHSQ